MVAIARPFERQVVDADRHGVGRPASLDRFLDEGEKGYGEISGVHECRFYGVDRLVLTGP
jgi:hypothetical protein